MDWLIGGAMAGLFGLLIWAAVEDNKQWEQFKAAHECRKVSYERPTVHPVTTFGANGQVQFGTATSPSKTGWLCNDGVTYIR